MNIVVVDSHREYADFLVENINRKNRVLQSAIAFDDFPNDIEFYKNIDLVIFDIDSKNSFRVIQKIKEIKSTYSDINLIATSFEINPKIVTQVLAQGATDFLLKPIIPNVLENVIKKFTHKQHHKGNTISVFSTKGGIGKTSIVTNLAWELYQKTNDKICIIDLSYNSEDVALFLDIKQNEPIKNIIENIENYDEETLLEKLGKYNKTKIYLLEAQENILPKFSIAQKDLVKTINSLKNIFDYIIIDTSNIINEINFDIFDNSDLILLATTTSKASIKSCQKCYELFDKIGYNDDKIKLVVNRYIDNQEITIEQIEQQLNHKVFHAIANNYLTLIDAISLKRNVGETNPHSNIAKAYAKLADEILKIDFVNLKTQKAKTNGIFDLIQKMGEE